jgi:hypothetical protein
MSAFAASLEVSRRKAETMLCNLQRPPAKPAQTGEVQPDAKAASRILDAHKKVT